MDTYTIGADETGVYEIPLTAGNITLVHLATRGGNTNNTAQISVHDASMPIYVRAGNTVTVKDPQSSVVLNGTWIDLPTGYADETDNNVALISAADATVSVARA
jgi:hypothetical protein